MISKRSPVTRFEPLGAGYFLFSLHSPEQARLTKPGHFFMLGMPGGERTDPLLNRPISALDVVSGPDGPEEVLFLVKAIGRGTRLLGSMREGETIFANGPIGSTFPVPEAGEKVFLVGGGVGIAPMHFCLRSFAETAQITLFYGGRSSEELPLIGRLPDSLPFRLVTATEDGSQGTRGLVTAPLGEWLGRERPDRIYTCGPNPMMRAVAAQATSSGAPVWVSMESRMACGIGVCLGCAITVDLGNGPAMVRVCKEGPVFESSRIDWERLPK